MNPAKWAVGPAALGPVLALSLACSGGGAKGGSAEDSGAQASPPTFTAIYSDILSGSCAQSFCHIGPGVVMQLSDQPTAYAQLVNAPATGPYCAGMGIRVVPGHPETSLMYLKLTAHPPPCGGSMPGRPPALTTAELQQIEQWIAMGAMND